MTNWQTNVREVFEKVLDYVSELHPFSAGTYSADQVKAGLFEFANSTNVLLEDSNLQKKTERAHFFGGVDIHDGMGQDELYDIIERLEFYMKSKFPNDSLLKGNSSERAFVKAEHVAEKISQMSVSKIEDYAHKFDRMIGIYYGPKKVVNDNHL